MFVETEKMELLPIRKPQRVLVRVPLSVSGKMVSKGQRLRLFQAKSRQQEFCVVTHVEPIEDGLTSVRVHFLEPHPEFWHITFPPDDWTPRHADSKFNRRSQLQNSDVRECVGVGNC